MNKFTINGKQYTAIPFSFNTICDLEEMGIQLNDVSKKPTAVVRAYFALHLGGNTELAGNEIEAHIISGGNMDEIANAMSKEMENSDFFRSISKIEKEEVATDQGKTTEKKSVTSL